MGIFAGVPLGRGIKWEWGCRRGNFWWFEWLLLRKLQSKANSTIWRYPAPCRPLTDCKMNDLEWPWLAISCQYPFLASTSWLGTFDFQKITAWKVINMDPCYQRSKCRSMTLVSGNINYFYIFESVSHICCGQTGVGRLKSTTLQFSRCYIFVSIGNNVDIVVRYDNNPFWISTDTTKDDLEWPWMPDSS